MDIERAKMELLSSIGVLQKELGEQGSKLEHQMLKVEGIDSDVQRIPQPEDIITRKLLED